ncbi:MAG: hypothetical protein DRJ42_13415 [Deltaproteobacteria bacterium]|nr:MAG: hypothetical protein DRJ42_13415 [Deltaproteobacteria bacterium]
MNFTVGLLVSLAACSSNDGAPADEPEHTPSSSGGGEHTEAPAEDPVAETQPTSDPTLEEASGEFEWLMFHDIQGLHGGRALYIRPDGTMVAQKVSVGEPYGLRDNRFEGALDADARARIAELLVEHDVRAMVVPNRPGIPDEARAVLVVRFRDGTVTHLAKWNGVRYEPFSALYRHLMGIADALAAGSPSHEGAFDYSWRPDGVTWPPL